MSDYTKGKIYIIKCLISNKCYIGSTCTTLHTREKYHKNIYNVCSSKEIIKNGNYNFELLEKFPCSSNRELEIRERYYQDIYKSSLVNQRRAFVSKDELKNEKIVYDKKYRKDNKIFKNERDNKYYEIKSTVGS